ncbi:S1 P1 [Babesia ovis]|uniref:S1 P1 n=1 Tax=Babesia ovis TaxID=5869 RepID=A0A9W5TCK8_BABOV|nr:S1 P1 [Babesia ovis]
MVAPYLLPFCGLLLLFGQPILAWDDLCREAIESTAMSAITMDRLRRMKVILRGHDLVDYTWWAGEVKKRIPESAPLHKQLQKDASCASFDASCPNDLCLIKGAKFFFAKLMNSGYGIVAQPTKFEPPLLKYPKDITFAPADSLKYLVVLLADMHYPFNVDLEDPFSIAHRKVDVTEFPMWQSLCMEKLGHSNPTFEEFISKVYMPHYIHTNEESWYGAWTNVDVLGTRYKVEQEIFNRNTWDNFEIWAAETANLNCATLVMKSDIGKDKNTIRLSEELLDRIGTLIRFQIVLAGARIAVVMNYILSHREIAYCDKTGLPISKDPKDVWVFHDYLFVFLVCFVVLVLLTGLYFFWLGLMVMFKDHFVQKVDNALQRWRSKRKSKYAPHLDVHEE